MFHTDSCMPREPWIAFGGMSAMGQLATSAGHVSMSERSPEAVIELSCVNVAEKHRRGVSKSTFPAIE